MFLSDVMKNIDLYTRLDFVTVQSYGKRYNIRELKLTKDITADIKANTLYSLKIYSTAERRLNL